ncbi:MAG: hypothetical protein ACRCX2_18945 [Paraclostridium sp.]
MTKCTCPHCGNYIDPASILGSIMTDKKKVAIKANLAKANEARKRKREQAIE